MARRSVMKHDFGRIPSVKIKRSSFDRSHGYKTAFDAADLIPVFVDEVLPGDTVTLNMTALARLATPIKPIMDNIFLDSFFFFVPNRLLWDNWEKFNGAQDNPADSTDFTIPQITAASGVPANSLYDYMGIPPSVANTSISCLHPRAYALIWNEWFRDENLQDSADFYTGDATEAYTKYTLLKRGKRHDYFTGCLPWPQKGDAITLPLGTTAPVVSEGDGIPLFDVGGDTALSLGSDSVTGANNAGWSDPTLANDTTAVWNDPKLETDLTNATAATINSLRQGFQIQRMLERDARGGTRYTEIVRSHYGVISPDARLQRPEYLGGGSTMVNISPIARTNPDHANGTTSDSSLGVGYLGAMGTAQVTRSGFTKSFTEHGVLIGLVSARADLTYQQGLQRMWSRSTRYDFFWPTLAHIGEQAVLNQEIYYQGDGATNDEQAFGYQERFAEYRYKPSMVTGLMRSSHASSVDVWHLSQEFASLPVLGDTFIQENPPIDRAIAVQSEPHFIFDAYFKMRHVRPMPVYGVPGFIDRF